MAHLVTINGMAAYFAFVFWFSFVAADAIGCDRTLTVSSCVHAVV